MVEFAPGDSPRKKAVVLLQAAAEVEHQFIVQYLYAYYCGGMQNGDEMLFTIAEEEMGHLLTVQNLLRLIGEPPHLARMDVLTTDVAPPAFQLQPLSIPFAATFLVAESSKDQPLPTGLETHLPPGLDLAHINRVGALYLMLYSLFHDPAGPAGPWDLTEIPGLA
jgi:hypothetical protein